jgi:YebC/PmpR family DNA-binding regulatory protein
MSGHSKWSKVKHQKAAVDAKRGKLFTKLIREITVAAKLGGPDPAANPRLRAALAVARGHNMAQDTMMRAVNKGAGGNDGVEFEAIVYEGYGPSHAAVIVEALTDNRNRTASSLRSTFSKYDGNLGGTNSVSYLFDHVGKIWIDQDRIDEDSLTEYILEAGADDLQADGKVYTVMTSLEAFEPVKAFLERKGVVIGESELIWQPRTKLIVKDRDKAETVMNFLEALEDDDDVQKVFTNLDEEALARLGSP